MSLTELRSLPPDRCARNYNRFIWKEAASREHASRLAAAPDPLLETQRSLGLWSQDSQRSSRLRSDDDSALASQRSSAHVLSRSASLPVGGPQVAEVPATFGSGFLGKPCYFDPLADKSLAPKPQPGLRITAGADYVPCRSTGSMGVMVWDQGRSHKTAARLQREQRASSRGPDSPLNMDASDMSMPSMGGLPVLNPPTPPPLGFGGLPARIRNQRSDHYCGGFRTGW